MLKTEVHKLIDAYLVNPGDVDNTHNVLSQPSIHCKSGRWNIPEDKYRGFLEKIHEILSSKKKNLLHFLEVPNINHNMVKVDIDLRFEATEDELKQKVSLKRRYTEELIETIINIIATNLGEIIETPPDYKIYVQEKETPRISHQEKIIKDGIHIIIPDLVMSNQSLYYLREQIIENDDLREIVKEIGNLSLLKDVIDKRIIFPNAWFIYGCGKPDDKGEVYKVTKIYKIIKEKNNDYSLKMVQSNKTLKDYIFLFSNYNKEPNVKYLVEFNEDEKYSNDTNTKYLGKEYESVYKSFVQDQNNFRKASTLSPGEIKTFLDCLKKSRADDYEDWCRVGLSLFNMDHRNYEIWKSWSIQSKKYDEQSCKNKWWKEFPKASKYNLGLTKIKELAKTDNPEKYKKIININKQNFFQRWLQAHIDEKDIHAKGLSVDTMTKFVKSYIMDYANFNVACALPGGAGSVYYKFEMHRWSKDEGANKVYLLLTETIKTELNEIFRELRQIIDQGNATVNRGRTRNNSGMEDDESVASYQRFIVDDRDNHINPEQLANEAKAKIYAKLQHEKCSALIQYLDKPANKKTLIEELSQKCYDPEFYKKLDDNINAFVCTNGVLDLDTCIFRDGQPSDMMTMSSYVEFPKNIDTVEAQEILCAIQDWLDKIFPDDEVQAYVLNTFACKLSGKLFGEKFHIFTGSGANGKSQFFKFIKDVFGDYFMQADNTLLNTPKRDPNSASPAIAGLKSKRIVTLTEPKNNLPFESDKVKELVSGDPLTGRHLNKDPIQFVPQYAMFLQCNDIPNNESTDDGFWRKIFIVPCESKFIIKEEDLYKLDDPVKYPNHFRGQDQSHLYRDWAPYFLYLLFERYKELKINNFRYPVPDKMKVATREYQDKASTYIQFFNEKIEEAPGYKVDASTLYLEFQNSFGREVKTTKSQFIKQMERLVGIPKGKNKEYYGFRIHGTSGEPIEAINSNN